VANDVHRLDDVRVMRVTQKGTAARSFARGRGVRIDMRGPLPLTPKAVWEQRDGKLLVVGDREQSAQNGVLVRLHADGSVDESFGDEGYVALDWPGGELYWHALRFAEQADGRLVVAGPVPGEGHRVRIVRLNEDGTRDTSFGSGGSRELNDFYKPDLFVVRPDGKILVGGGDGDGEIPDVDWRLRRLNADGSIDDSFAADFRVRSYHEFKHVPSEPGGGLLLVGTTAHVTEDWRPHEGPRPIGDDLVLVRLEADGSLDDSYYDGGVRVFDDIRATHVLDVRRLKGGDLRILTQDRWRDTGQGWFRHVRIDGDGAVTSSPVHDGKFGWRTAVAPNGDLLLFYESNTVRLKPAGTTQVLEPVVEYYNLLGSDADGRVYVGSRDEANGFALTRWLVD
jgi:uncharacterized delta-60 repeat protein